MINHYGKYNTRNTIVYRDDKEIHILNEVHLGKWIKTCLTVKNANDLSFIKQEIFKDFDLIGLDDFDSNIMASKDEYNVAYVFN